MENADATKTADQREVNLNVSADGAIAMRHTDRAKCSLRHTSPKSSIASSNRTLARTDLRGASARVCHLPGNAICQGMPDVKIGSQDRGRGLNATMLEATRSWKPNVLFNGGTAIDRGALPLVGHDQKLATFRPIA